MEVFEGFEEFQSGLLFLLVVVVPLDLQFVCGLGLEFLVYLDGEDEVDGLDLGLGGLDVVIVPHEFKHLLGGWSHGVLESLQGGNVTLK